ncbi:MAG: hypothetical protein AAGB31_15730 [Bdellovibrio sp.]
MKDSIRYMQDVLGLQTVMISSSSKSEEGQTHTRFFLPEGPYKPTELQYYELIFLNILTQKKESLFRSEVQALFEKMKTAMRIKNIRYVELDCTVEDRSKLPSELARLCESKVVVVFSSFPKDLGEMIYKGPGSWLETYSPAYLLEDAGAKKVVWNDLQKVMKELSL